MKIEDWRSRVLLPATVYLAVALVWCWPLPLHLTNRFTSDPGDPLLITYLIWWNAHAVPLTQTWWNAPYYWPMSETLALTDHLAGLSPITTPIQLAGGSPLLAYNLVLIAATWWSGLGAHALVRRLTGGTAAAYCAGIAFAYAPYRTSMVGHLQIYACWWLPLIFFALHVYYEERRIRWLAVASGSWLLQGLTNGYFLLFVPVLIGCWLAWFTRRAQIALAARAGIAFAAAAVAALPFLLHYRAVQTAHGLARDLGEMVAYSAYPGALLRASPMMRFGQTVEPWTSEQYLFPGVTALALTLTGLLVSRRDRRFQFYAGAAVLMTLFAAGPAVAPGSWSVLWRPYTWLTWLPGFGGLRVPARFYMLAVCCLAVAAGIAFQDLRRRVRSRALVTGLSCLVFAGLAIDGSIAGMPLGAPPPQLPLQEAGARVLALPFEEGRVSVFAMYQSMSHRLPVVNGYSGYIPPHADVIEWALRRRDPSVLTELRRGHPLYVLVAPTDQAETWTHFMDQQPGAEMLGIHGGGRLYRMPATGYAHEIRPGVALTAAGAPPGGEWLTLDLGQVRTARSLELRTQGNLVRLPKDFIVQTSVDNVRWTTAIDERPGGAALVGVLRLPRVVPLLVDLKDVEARYVRVNAPYFGARDVTIYGP